MCKGSFRLIAFAVVGPLTVPVIANTLQVDDGLMLNPVRKVVSLLQSMQNKVEAEGAKERDLYSHFMCYCRTASADLSRSISTAEMKVPTVGSSIEAAYQKLKHSEATVSQAYAERKAARSALAEASAIREKEAAAFIVRRKEFDVNIEALSEAIEALHSGLFGAFLQTNTVQTLRALLNQPEILDADRQELLVFLSSHKGDYTPQNVEIAGILMEMDNTMTKELAEAAAAEHFAIQQFKSVTAAKSGEVSALTSTIEVWTRRTGELNLQAVGMKEDLSNTEAMLSGDKEFLAELQKGCATKTAEWQERSKMRAEELAALADTIKVLNDDEALGLFRKTLSRGGRSSFLEVDSLLRGTQHVDGGQVQDRRGLDLLVLAMPGKKSSTAKGGLNKVPMMIDKMVKVLKREQHDDDEKKFFCRDELGAAGDKRKALHRKVGDEEVASAEASEAAAEFQEEVAALMAGIRALDKLVAEATEQRKAEHMEFQELMVSSAAAKELLNFAKNRLQKYYKPTLYKSAPKVELSAEDRIFENLGGNVTTAAPSGIAKTGIVEALVQKMVEHRKESAGVLAMLDVLMQDLEKTLVEAATEEKEAQTDYESMLAYSVAKRSTDSRALTEKTTVVADTKALLDLHRGLKEGAGKELMVTLKLMTSLHAECDWLLQYSEVRKKARAAEIDSLKQAKAVLSGASYFL